MNLPAERHNLARGDKEWADTYGNLGNIAQAQLTQLPLVVLDDWAAGCIRHPAPTGSVFLHRPDRSPLPAASAFAQAAGTCRPHLAAGKPGRAGIYTALP